MTHVVAGALASAALVIGAIALSTREPVVVPDGAPVRSTDERFEPDQRRAIERVRARLLAPGPPPANAEVPGKSSAEVLTYLADTSEDPRVIEAALREILGAYSSRSSQKPAPNADLERVLVKQARSAQPSVAAAALAAARIPLMTKQPSDALTSSIAELAEPEQESARRQAALEALGLIRPDRRAAPVLAAFEQALSAREPYLVSLALLALSESGPSLETLPDAGRARLAERVLELGTDADPGVRGRALGVLSEIEWLVPPETRFAAARVHLTDPHPYVRARAADLFLRCQEPAAIHALIGLTTDLTLARYELTGWTQLDGTPGKLIHVVPGRQRVAEAALLTIRSLSESLPTVKPFVLTFGGRPQSEALVLENAERARSWYRAEGSRIPRAPRR